MCVFVPTKGGHHYYCGGTGIDSTVPTNTVQVPNTTGTETDSGSVYIVFIGVIGGYTYIQDR